MLQRLREPSTAIPGQSLEGTANVATTDAIALLFLLAVAAATVFGPLPVAAFGAAGFVAFASRDRSWPIALVAFSTPFQPLERHVGPYAFSLTEIFIVLTAAGGLAGFTYRQLRRWLIDRARLPTAVSPTAPVWRWLWTALPGDRLVSLLAILLVLAALVSLTVSAAVHESVQSLRVVIVEPVAFYLLAASMADRKRVAFLIGFSLVLAGVAISLFGFWQYAIGNRIITAEADLRRIRGFYGSPNNFGLFLDRALPLALGVAAWWRAARSAFAFVAAVMVGALVLTYSLGAWAAVAGATVVIAALRGRRVLAATLLAGLIGAIAIGVLAISIPRIGSHFDLQSSTSAIRLDVWRSAFNMLADHPIRGVGLDNFLYYYQHGYRLASAWQDPNLSHPHNLLLDFWLSLGLPGPIIIVALLGRFAVLVRAGWAAGGAVERGLLAGAAGAMVAMALHGLVDNSFFLPDLAVLFWALFVIVAGMGIAPVKSPAN
jgi:O-antigen ligase